MAHSTALSSAIFLAVFGSITAPAQTSRNVTLNLKQTSTPLGHTATNTFVFSQNGTVGPLGTASLFFTSSSTPIVVNGPLQPIQMTAGLYFNEVDHIDLNFTESDPHFYFPQNFDMTGTITGGGGAYTGGTGSLTIHVVKGNTEFSHGSASGTGSVTVGAKTTQLTFLDFHGFVGTSQAQRNFQSGDFTGTASPLGNVTATIKQTYDDNRAELTSGTVTVSVNSTDSFTIWFSYFPDSLGNPPVSFTGNLAGGTGAYAAATGVFSMTLDFVVPTTLRATGTIITPPAGAPVITQVKTVAGLPQVALNTWLQINGTNLVPADTPAAGVDWSNAPEFAQGMLPTQVGPISVTINGRPAFVYFYCSAVTDPACAAGGDQINVLAPLLLAVPEQPANVVVTNNGVSSPGFVVFKSSLSPAFLVFDAVGHIAARHVDYSLLGPSNLYPGFTTPAKAGETVILVASGFGASTTQLVNGSSMQSGSLIGAPSIACWVSGNQTTAAAAIVSPGLYQLNLVVPSNTPRGDNQVMCEYAASATSPGALLTVQ